MNAPLTGATLPKNEFFAVSEEVSSADGRIYLCVADGRGWAFDDSALMPYNPTVVKGRFVPTVMEPPMVDHSVSVALPPTVAPVRHNPTVVRPRFAPTNLEPPMVVHSVS